MRRGCTAQLHEGRRLLTRWCVQVLVWKEIRYGRMSEKEKSMLVSEVNILRELKHPNIVRYKVRVMQLNPCPRTCDVLVVPLAHDAWRLVCSGPHYRQRDLDHLHHHGILRKRRSLLRHSQVCCACTLRLFAMVALAMR